jgi:hypothetical protein
MDKPTLNGGESHGSNLCGLCRMELTGDGSNVDCPNPLCNNNETPARFMGGLMAPLVEGQWFRFDNRGSK